ncbi:hypothetical protein [Candidatus Uabimicrobium sp. HlEnr_7]|uniref:hypothetical protein n=1 Tax=Candidatus Uabimicrobium helgolandensis TaxID=3095367 RepID=UPI003557B512
MKHLWLFYFLLLCIYSQNAKYFASLEYKLTGHNNIIEECSVSNDSKILASGDWDGIIQLWSLKYGIKKTTIARHQQKITGLHFTQKKQLVSSSEDGTIRLWNYETGQQLYSFIHNSPVTKLAVSNNFLIAVDSNRQIFTIDLKTKKYSLIAKLKQKIKHLKIRDDNQIVVADQKGSVYLYQVDGTLTKEFSAGKNIVSIDVYKDYIATATTNRQVKVWRNTKLATTFTLSKPIRQISFAKSARKILVYSGGNAYIYSIKEKKIQTILSEAFFYNTAHSNNWNYFIGLGNKIIHIYRLLANNQRAFSGDMSKYVRNNLHSVSKKMPPGVLILPFTTNNKTTQRGSLLSIMSMFYATYTPKKTMNLPFKNIENFFYEHNWLLDNQLLKTQTIQNAQQQYSIKNTLTGKLTRKASGYNLSISFRGEFPPRQQQKFFHNMSEIPQWVASKIHEYTKTTPPQKTNQKISDNDIEKIADIYPVYFASRFTTELYSWKKLAQKNQQSPFIAAHYAYSYSPDHLAPIWHLLRVRQKNNLHTYLNEVLANFYLKEKQNIKALNIYLYLLKQDTQNPQIYKNIMQILTQEDEWEVQRLVLLYCQGTIQDLYWYNTIAANYYINHAWKILPQANGKNLFREKMLKAKNFLQAAYKTNIYRWQAPTYMIKIITALKEPQNNLDLWFQKATTYSAPREAYSQKFHYLTPRWYGNKETMLRFARTILKQAAPYSPLRFIILDAHRELLPDDYYYTQKEVWRDIQQVFVPYLKVYTRDRIRRIWYWEYAMLAKQFNIAAEQYIKLQQLGQLQSLLSSTPFQKIDKTHLFTALAQKYKLHGNQKKYAYWLEQALRKNPRNWDLQEQYASFLLESNNQDAAYAHIEALVINNNKWQQHAQQKIATMTPKQITIPQANSQILYILVAGKLPEHLLNKLRLDIQQKFKIQVKMIPKSYAFNKHLFIPEQRKKIQQSLQQLYRIVGKNKVEAYRAVYNLEQDSSGDLELLQNLLQKTAKGQKMIRDLKKNYHDRWNAKATAQQIKKEYSSIVNAPNSLGILLLTNQAIGTIEKGQKYTFAIPKVAIFSIEKLFRVPLTKSTSLTNVGYERTLKLTYNSIAGILGISPSTAPQCPLSFADSLFAVDTQTTEFSYASKKQLVEQYQRFLK